MNATPEIVPPEPPEPPALDLRDLALRIWAQRVRVLAATLAAGVLGVLLAAVLPRWYRAAAVILPPEETDLVANLGVMGQALSKFPALGEFGEYTTPADIYRAILESRTVREEVADRFDLMRVYHLHSRELTLKALASHTTVRLNPDGTIGVTVEDRDPKRSAALALGMLQALDHYNIEKRSSQGHRTRLFLEQRVHETDSLLLASEAALRQYQETHHAVAPTTVSSGEVNAAADLMSRRVALEIRLGVMRGYLREDNEQIVQAQRELAELDRQLGALPVLQTDLARLIRDNKVQEQLYLLLTAELEDARVQELRDTPTVTILDAPVPPEHHSRPRKSVFGLVSAVLGLIGACAVVARVEPAPPTRRG